MDDLQKQIAEKGLPPLIQRKFVKLSDPAEQDESIRVMQWNLLAQGLLTIIDHYSDHSVFLSHKSAHAVFDLALTLGEENFNECPAEALLWENRKLRMVEEILRYKPTVLCLEEVDMYEYLLEQLSKYGYMGIFFAKPDSPCLYIRDNNGPDGCAVFYLPSKLNLIKSDSIVLKFEDGFPSNQVSIICNFQTKSENPKDFYVAGTHLKAKPGFEDSRREQSKYLTNYIYEKYQGNPIIICGDFNGDYTEPLYTVMTSSKLDLTSAYTSLSPEGKEPKYTTWKIRPKGEACHTIDYMWYTKNGLKLVSLLDVASEEEIGENRLPSFRYPSDHISLVCDFVLE